MKTKPQLLVPAGWRTQTSDFEASSLQAGNTFDVTIQTSNLDVVLKKVDLGFTP